MVDHLQKRTYPIALSSSSLFQQPALSMVSMKGSIFTAFQNQMKLSGKWHSSAKLGKIKMNSHISILGFLETTRQLLTKCLSTSSLISGNISSVLHAPVVKQKRREAESQTDILK